VRVRGAPNEKINQCTKEITTGKKDTTEKKTRKRETMCETSHREAKKKKKSDPEKCNKKQKM
jgi:hypothetical protein